MRELTAELWSFLSCKRWFWERWCWEEPPAVTLPLAVAVVKQPQGQNVACMGGVWIRMYESDHHDWNTGGFHQRNKCRGFIKEWVLLCAVCGLCPATVICSSSLEAPCSRCDYINIKIISCRQSAIHASSPSLISLSWKCALLKGTMSFNQKNANVGKHTYDLGIRKTPSGREKFGCCQNQT